VSAVTAVHPHVDFAVDEHELLRRWHVQHDEAARAALIEQMLPLVRSLARRYANRGEPLDDLEQVGCVGLIKAVDRFDVDRGLRFSTFAVPTILGEIKRHFRDRAWSVRVSRGLQELSARVAREVDRLSTKLGRSPTIEDLAQATGSTPEQVLEALQGAHAYSTVPLEETAARTTATSSRRSASSWRARCGASAAASARSCCCASSAGSRSARSPSASGSRRCTSRACCGARWSGWARRSATPSPCSAEPAARRKPAPIACPAAPAGAESSTWPARSGPAPSASGW
jgi:RNA polymerase sigma factor (sigma-70 family)